MTVNKKGLTYSNLEMMAVAACRLLRNDDVAIVGTGLPLVGATLAKFTHAADMHIIMEAVAFDSKPLALPYCVADPRAVYKTTWVPTAFEVMGQLLQNGSMTCGFLGGAQVDKYGNLNSTCIGDYFKPITRLEGSGGACDIALLAQRTIIIMAHEKRRFVNEVDYITSPGWKPRSLDGKTQVDRSDLGLRGGPDAVVSTMGVMRFDAKTHEMYVDLYFADLGITLEDIQANTEFEIDVSRAKASAPPSAKELEVLRTVVDEEGMFMKY